MFDRFCLFCHRGRKFMGGITRWRKTELNFPTLQNMWANDGGSLIFQKTN